MLFNVRTGYLFNHFFLHYMETSMLKDDGKIGSSPRSLCKVKLACDKDYDKQSSPEDSLVGIIKITGPYDARKSTISIHSAVFFRLVLQVTPSICSGRVILVLHKFPIVRLVVDQMMRDFVGRVLLHLAASGAVVLQRIRQIFFQFRRIWGAGSPIEQTTHVSVQQPLAVYHRVHIYIVVFRSILHLICENDGGRKGARGDKSDD